MRSSLRTAAGVSALAVAAAWGVWRYDQKQTEAQQTIQALNDRLDQLQQVVGKQQSASSIVAKALNAPRSDVHASAEVHGPNTQVAEAPAEPALTQQELQQQLMNQLEDRFHGEPPDRAWSADMSAQIRRTMIESVPTAHVLDASCAASLCKVVVRHDSLEDQRQIAFKLGALGPFRSGVYYQYDAVAKPPTTTLYVNRETEPPDQHADAR